MNLPTHQFRQQLLHARELEEADRLSRLKLDKAVHVAFRSEIRPKHRSEEGQACDPVRETEFAHPIV